MVMYAEFARFYDQIMGDRAADVERMLGYIGRHRPDARALLELGCGTGAVLAGLTAAGAGLSVAGVDRSPEMLAHAASAVPAARLVQADITSFAIDATFDVVICVFDTLNHLPEFRLWQELFDRVREHLADGGIFAFDVNTTGRLRGLQRGFAFAEDFGADTVIMDVTPGGGDLSRWEVRIFERVGDDLYRMHREVIPELGVPLARIRAALAADFELLEESGLDGGPPTDESARAFFAYRYCPGRASATGGARAGGAAAGGARAGGTEGDG